MENQLLTVNGKTPILGKNCKVFPTAILTGDIETGQNCTFWFQSVVRGDVNAIRIGQQVNVQDGAILHCTYNKAALTIGDRVSIGHRAIVHGCTVKDDVLIGMGSIVMDHAVVESNCLIAAGAIVTQGMHCESGYIYAGIPAKPIKELSPEMMAGEVNRIASAYQLYASWYTMVPASK